MSDTPNETQVVLKDRNAFDSILLPEQMKRTQFDATKRELRYQVHRVDLENGPGAVQDLKTSCCYVLILTITSAEVMMALGNNDFIVIRPGDWFRVSMVDTLRFKRLSGAATSSVMVLTSGDPYMTIQLMAEASAGVTRPLWNPSIGA